MQTISAWKKSACSNLILLLVLQFVPVMVHASPEKLRIGLLCPAPVDHAFWGQVVQVMRAAAHDLKVELVVRCDEQRSADTTKKLGNELLMMDPKIDYFLSGYWTDVSKYHLELALQQDIKVLIFNAEVKAEDLQTVGWPRQLFPNWIGHLVPNDTKAGMRLADILITAADKAGKRAADGKVHVVGLIAGSANTVGSDRRNGLLAQAYSMKAAHVNQIVSTYWERGSARQATLALLEKYPETSVIWTATETMAWGALAAVEDMKKEPGKDVFVGGFDWNPDTLTAIEEGKMTASMFGHFLEGMWALILAHDHYHGYDFIDDTGVRIPTSLFPLTPDNVTRYRKVLNKKYWSDIDFRVHSKKYNPKLKAYQFNFDNFISE